MQYVIVWRPKFSPVTTDLPAPLPPGPGSCIIWFGDVTSLTNEHVELLVGDSSGHECTEPDYMS